MQEVGREMHIKIAMKYLFGNFAMLVVALALVIFTSGCGPAYIGKWESTTSDGYPSVSIHENSSSVTVVLIEGRLAGSWDLVSFSGVCDAPTGDDKSGWNIQGELDGDTAFQGHHSVKIHIGPNGKTGTVQWRGHTYDLKPQ